MAMKKKTIQVKSENTPKLTGQYETEIEYICPVRGLVKQKVMVKKYAGIETQLAPDIRPSSSITDQLDVKFSGLILDDNTIDDNESKDKGSA
jgi:hypothetical protein